MPKTLVSMGQSCQSAHQLARFCSAHPQSATFQKGPFDWLICPPESICSWLNAGLEDFQIEDVVEYRDHAYWEKHQFWFWHGFFRKAGDFRRLDIEGTMERELSKLAYQREAFCNLDPKNTVFIISNTQNNLAGEVFEPHETKFYSFTKATIDSLEEALCQFFGSTINLHTVSRSDRIDSHLVNHPKVTLLDPEISQWKGSDTNWDQILFSVV